jgi:sulfur-carrier protein adenylyltransferase/sulfurtransferase
MDSRMTKTEITPKELKKRLDTGEDIVILDVREPQELKICRLNNTFHVPMGDLQNRVSELNDHKAKEIVVYCRSGGRSGHCANYLRSQGFTHVLNLEGGILAWSDEIDPTLQKY